MFDFEEKIEEITEEKYDISTAAAWVIGHARRTGARSAPVPESVVDEMTAKTVLPTPDEAQTVEWICV